ncbi:hypothetical protein QBC38DRAFT_118397 [Podospora fimiseda]|uniref:Uncharacterized protein n=1 Tax=Podospora fimiseda TaxID=252190 RepID=A0AAN7BTA2_9PEZI|nr:hypothetical protein QBC38DRAFT_118397 [Podospora fimiseda]
MLDFFQTSGALILFFFATPSHAFNWKNNANFSACYANFVSKIPQNCSDERQVCVNNTFGDLTHPGHVYITYDICLAECGDGFGFWDIKDVLLRVSLWVIPAIVLIAHYHFPPLGAYNMICSVAHIVADPIDTLWCLLTRITIRHRLLDRAKEWDLLSAGAIATIWSTYDEFGFQDPSDDFKIALDGLRSIHGYPGDFLGVKHGRLADRSITSRSLEPNLPLGQKLKSFFLSHQSSENMLLEQAQLAIRDLSSDERRLSYHIELTAQRLVFNREETLLPTWVSILGLASAMMGAFVRTWTERLNNQTAHTIATVTLLLFIVPIVKLSGNLGAFTSSTASIDIINTLHKDLEDEFSPEVAALFPPFKNISRLSTQEAGEEEEEGIPLTSLPNTTKQFPRALLLLSWPSIAPYKGLNNSYRPHKPFSLVLLLISTTWILCLSYIPALLISYLTPLKGFSCRSLAWTIIASLWILSLLTSILISFFQQKHHRHSFLTNIIPKLFLSPKKAYRLTNIRDFFVTTIIIIIITAQQLGFYNSCFCRSGELSGVKLSYVNLNPYTDEQFIQGWKMWVPTPGISFLVSLAGVLLIEMWYAKESGGLFVRGRKGREGMLVRVWCLDSTGM